MDPTETQVEDYLDERGLLHGSRVVRIAVTIRRNFCSSVELEDGSHWFVKQAPRTADGEQPAGVANEAAVLTWAHRSAAGAALRPLMTDVAFYDPENQVLVTEYLTSYRPLMDHYRRRRVFGHDLARALATRLARCHAVRPAADGTDAGAAGIRLIEQAPFPAWDRVTPEEIAAQAEGYVEFVEIVQNTDGLIPALRALRSAWRPLCLIHMDAKSDNIMFRPGAQSGGADLRLVDWELAGWGDPAWDTGTVVGDYLHHWLASVAPSAGGTLEDWLAGARAPFPRVQGAIAAFWQSYSRRCALPVDGPEATRTAGYAGVFLLTRALATVVTTGELGLHGLCVLQVAKQLIRDPETAAGSLLW